MLDRVKAGLRSQHDPSDVEILDAARLVAFSDSVFAVAITLLVLSINIPEDLNNVRYRAELRDAVPSLEAYALSFAVISSFWLAHHRCFARIRKVDNRLLVLNLLFLAVVTLIPFPTDVLGNYGDHPSAVMMYAGAVGGAAFLSWSLWWYATRNHHLVDPDIPVETMRQANFRGLAVSATFFGSIPVALVDADLAKYMWFAPLFVMFYARRRKVRVTSAKTATDN
jgi:uncharacterized membrane protein